ncbi:hypothetical protein [Paenibacillus taichungensis]
MAITEIQVTKSTAKHEKKRLEEKGIRSSQYWIRRKPISADFLRKMARSKMINAINLNTDGVITWYYSQDAVDVACAAYNAPLPGGQK